MRVGTDTSGGRTDCVEVVLCIIGLLLICGGDDDMIPVEDVGTGVGYFDCSLILLGPDCFDGEK